MSIIGKIIGAVLLKRGLVDSTPLFYGLLSHIVAIMVLIIILTIMMGSLFVGGLFLAYWGMVNAGLSIASTVSIIIAVVAVIMAIMFNKIFFFEKKIKRTLYEIITSQSPLASKAGGVFQAFVAGLFQNNNKGNY